MQLAAYLERIGHSGAVRPDFATLRAIHRAHLLTIPYENLDIHLGRPLVLDQARFFEKLVVERRGGWCFEMNGLLAWALREIGFRVELLAGAVGRAARGDGAEGNHLVLLVELERPYLADVGFGNGFLEPLPLAAGVYHQGFLTYQLEGADGRWVFTNDPCCGPGFDLTLTSRRLTDFAGQCDALQTEPTSGFVRTTVCHRFTPDGIMSLRGAVLRMVRAVGVTTHTLSNAVEFAELLERQFDLNIPHVATLWPAIWQRHQSWLAEQETHERTQGLPVH